MLRLHPGDGVAAVVVSPDRRSTSFGYAGLPRDCTLRLEAECARDSVTMDALCRHAERNAISNAGRNLEGWTLYSTKAPCVECAMEAYANRVVRVVSPPPEPKSRWHWRQVQAARFMHELGVEVVHLSSDRTPMTPRVGAIESPWSCPIVLDR